MNEEERLEILKRAVDYACQLILKEDYPDVDIEIEKNKVRRLCEELFPDKMYLFDMIYEARFKRLYEQFRKRDEGPQNGR